MTISTGPTLLAQIDTELQAIQVKLYNNTASTTSTLAAHIATLKANIAITKAVEVLITDAGGAGTGLGLIAAVQGGTDLETWFNAAIVIETP